MLFVRLRRIDETIFIEECNSSREQHPKGGIEEHYVVANESSWCNGILVVGSPEPILHNKKSPKSAIILYP